MYLLHLSLTNYRAFTRLDMDLPRRILLLLGENAQGKTSLLEAVYYLATFTSFHARNNQQLINFEVVDQDLAVARLEADYVRGEQKHHLEVRLIQETNGNGIKRVRKEILQDGVKRSMQDALGHFNAVIFLPQMMQIIEGGPDFRRKFLNLTISQAVKGYAASLSEYNQVLTQRNALLKLLSERKGDVGQLTYWDELLTSRGAMLIHTRIRMIHEVERIATRIHNRLTDSKEILRLVYQPSFDPLPKPEDQFVLPMDGSIDRTAISREKIKSSFSENLEKIRRMEIARGVTTIGPHRDELRFLANGIDLNDFGSRGQVRTALLSLKLAEVVWLKENTGQWPVLLLDEIMAELDVRRRQDLMEYFQECEQSIMTTTDPDLFSEEFLKEVSIWNIRNGMISSD